MDTKRTIRKILFITMWMVIGGGMLTLLLAAIGKKNKEHCNDYLINVKAGQNKFFIDEKDVLSLLTMATDGDIKDRPIASFNLRRLQALLEDNVWIKKAELYFDNQNVLHVNVEERQPIARIFATAGNSFYIDEALIRLPLSNKTTVRVPVFSSFPDRKFISAKDKELLDDIKTMAEFIDSDPFWMSQVAQIDITNGPSKSAGWNFEMIPVVGNHIVEMGDGENIQQKFHRLYIFYKEVLSKEGFNYYKNIDVEYAGQVVAVRGKPMSKVDSIQLRRNVEKLLQEAQQMQSDTTFTTNPIVERPKENKSNKTKNLSVNN